MEANEIEFLSLRERIRELETKIKEQTMLIDQKNDIISELYQKNTYLQELLDDMANEQRMYFGTRNQDGQTKEYMSFTTAVMDFLSYDGYRLDIIIEGFNSIHIYRDELPKINENRIPEFQNACIEYDSKILVFRTKGE